MLGLVTAGVVYWMMPMQQAAAQAGGSSAPGTPPIGLLVDVTLVAWPLSTQRAEDAVKGTLLSMTGEWIVVKSGSYENWIPKEKVLCMKASR